MAPRLGGLRQGAGNLSMVTQRRTTDYLRNILPPQPIAVERNEGTPVLPPECAQLLRTLCALAKPQSILEIGTNVGYSAITMLLAAPQASLYTVEMSEETAGLARENMKKAGVYERSHIYIGKAEEILPYMQGCYDLIFLDGPKGQYALLSEYLIPLLKSGGLLVCDNVLFRGMVSGQRKVTPRKRTLCRKLDLFLRQISADPSLETTVLPIGDGISISVKR